MINNKKQITNNKLYKILKLGIFVFIVICLEFGIWSLGFAKPALAQEVSLSITPPVTELTIQPGKSYSQTFTVKDDGTPVILVPEIFPFVPLDNLGHAELIEDKNSVDVFSNWFSFDPSPISLTTTGSHDFIVKITPPADAEEKDYYFTFIVEVQNGDDLGITSSQAQGRIGANVLLSISKDGNPQKSASITEFSAPKIMDSFSGLTYNVLIKNSGNSFFKPVGKISINQIGGPTTVLNLAPLNVLVGGSRQITCVQGEDLVPCKMPGKFLIGIYRSNLSFTLDGSGSTIEKETYTFAFPFSVLLGFICIFIFYRIVKQLKS